MIVNLLFYVFGAVLIATAVGVITARNPVHCALFLVAAFLNSAVIWLLLEAEFLAVTLLVVYVGAVMVLWLFVVMMLDIDVAKLRQGFTRYAPLGALVALIVVAQIGLVVWVRKLGLDNRGATDTEARGLLEHARARQAALHAVPVPLRDGGRDPARGDRRGDHADHAPAPGPEAAGHHGQVAVRANDRVRIVKMDAEIAAMIPLSHVLLLSGILFSLSVAGIFINRKNVLLLLMCIELMLLSVNFNFIAFSHHLGDLSGQVFVFFILTVAAAESAIGLAILVVLFRERKSINVEDLDSMKG